MNTSLFILKIGGSVATDKTTTTYSPRVDLLSSIFREIAKVLHETPLQLVIVHGGGGEVHSLAHEYDLREGARASERHKEGALKTQAATKRLNNDVAKVARASGVLATSVHTASVVEQKDGMIKQMHSAPILEALKKGLVPVLYGEMVPDTELELSICSGDALVTHLTTLLPVTHIAYATDVDGVYTSDPHVHADAVLLESITVGKPLAEQVQLSVSHNQDVTGGLRGKLAEVGQLFSTPTLTSVQVFNGFCADNFSKVLSGFSFPHTVIKR